MRLIACRLVYDGSGELVDVAGHFLLERYGIDSGYPSGRSNGMEAAFSSMFEHLDVAQTYTDTARAVLVPGDCLDTLRSLPDGFGKLIITSPPYNLGKEYETVAGIDDYLQSFVPIIDELVRVLADDGSLCWQVGNYVDRSEVFPLDVFYYPLFKQRGLKLRNRVIWHFEHGLHASKRFSGRYETLLWLTKGDTYTFNLDAVRVPSKYPGKTYFKGEKYGQPSGNPLGKNPSDFWRTLEDDWESLVWEIPNVKANHPEKTLHPCQFPIELVERCVLAMTNEGDWVLDPFAGTGSALIAALRHQRRALGCEKEQEYIDLALARVDALNNGTLRYRPLGKPVHQPSGREKVTQVPVEWAQREP
jgi:adenine-specific DNA-methyltransferase